LATIASLDIGLKRIGVALCMDGITPIPQKAIIRKGRKQAAKEVGEFLKEWEVDTVIVGLPKGGSSENEMKRRIEHFISLIEFNDNTKIYYQDEYGTSIEAKEMTKGAIKQKRDGKIDSIAASIILQRWLDTRSRD